MNSFLLFTESSCNILATKVPIGSASIGQVHRARLADTGSEVVVKAEPVDIIFPIPLRFSCLVRCNIPRCLRRSSQTSPTVSVLRQAILVPAVMILQE